VNEAPTSIEQTDAPVCALRHRPCGRRGLRIALDLRAGIARMKAWH